MWTSQSLNVLRHQPGALGYTEPEAPGDREHARGRPYPAQNTMIYRFAMSRRLVSTSVLQLTQLIAVSQTAPLRLSSVVFKHRMGTRRKRVESYRFPLPTVCFEC
jgi:hypothetical protein